MSNQHISGNPLEIRGPVAGTKFAQEKCPTCDKQAEQFSTAGGRLICEDGHDWPAPS